MQNIERKGFAAKHLIVTLRDDYGRYQALHDDSKINKYDPTNTTIQRLCVAKAWARYANATRLNVARLSRSRQSI